LDEKKQPNVETKQDLTCHKDEQVTLMDFCRSPDFAKASNPFEDQTPNAILTRQYLIDSIAWTPSFAGRDYDFPDALENLPAVAQALASFRYFKANVEIMIKISAIPYQAGLILATFYHDNVTGPRKGLDLVQNCVNSPVTLNVSTNDTVKLSHYWMSPRLYRTIGVTSEKAIIGTLTMQDLVPVRNQSGGTTTVQIQVYASFKNPQCAGFLSTVTRATAQSGLILPTEAIALPAMAEAVEKTLSNTVVKKTVKTFSAIFKSLPYVGDVYSTVARIVQTVGEMLDKPRQLGATMNILCHHQMIWQMGQDWIFQKDFPYTLPAY